MLNYFSLFYLLFAISLELQALSINIFSENNGKGLEQSRSILKNALLELGHSVTEIEREVVCVDGTEQVDINIFIETLIPEWFSTAKYNWFIPNPEWYDQPLSLIDDIDLILCRNHNVENLFQHYRNKTYFLGFTSQDYFREEIEKDYHICLHLAGGSTIKGTNVVVNTWSKYGDFLPPLYLQIFRPRHNFSSQNPIIWMKRRLPLQELIPLQNYAGIHICTSETEGWGHSIIEGMAVQAVVVTVDAPPMNEYIQDKRCLIPYIRKESLNLAIRYMIDDRELKERILYLTTLSREELEAIGVANRIRYFQLKDKFRSNLELLMKRTLKIRLLSKLALVEKIDDF